VRQTTAFLEAIKRCLKAKGITYRDLAKALGLSEASVKRLFSLESLTLKRAEQILAVLDMTLLEVAKLSASSAETTTAQLSLDQERALAADAKLFSLFHLLLFGLSLTKIVSTYDISRDHAERRVRSLEALGLVERTPRNEIVVRVKRAIVWRARGPLRQAYEQPVRARFLEDAFGGEHELRRFMTHRLSEASQALMIRKLKRLLKEMDGLSEADTAEEGSDASVSGLFVAFRPFEFEGIVGLRRRS
jgi:transcriptional regulator with XRE-family HTH domain